MSDRAGETSAARSVRLRSRFALPVGASDRAVLVVLVLGAAALRLAWLGAPLERDEAGYLLVAGQWHPGTSLYGDYWVDRPPLLIAFFALGHLLGGTLGLRLLACGVAALTVLASYALGRTLLKEGGSPLWPAAAAAAFISTPLFQVTTVNGELIAVPLVIAGTASVMGGISASQPERRRRWVAAGILGASGCLVKQNFLDVFVFAGSLLLAGWISRSAGMPRGRVRDLGWFLVGAGALTAGALLASAALGTTPQGLWDALVVFRVRAAEVLGHVGGSTSDGRAAAYPRTLLIAGALPLLAVGALSLLRKRTPLAIAVVCTVIWEIVGVLAGQQAWSHYLIGLAPGLVLATTLAVGSTRWIASLARLGVCYAGVATLVVVISTLAATVAPSPNQGVGLWLRASAHPGDQAVVLLGQPDILQTAGMGSPYEYMWTLPITVKDPHLDLLTRILNGPRAPVWVVQDVSRRKALARTQAVLQRRYTVRAEVCGYRVLLRVGSSRAAPAQSPTC